MRVGFAEARKRRRDILDNKRHRVRLNHSSGEILLLSRSQFPANGEISDTLDFGSPDCICNKCGASMWYQERIVRNTGGSNATFSLCCSNGRVNLSYLRDPPSYLKMLLTNQSDQKCLLFRQRLRTYNSLFAFTSMGGHVDTLINKHGRGPYVFRLNGQNHHHIGSLIPDDGQPPKFAQLYFYDTENEINNRVGAVVGNEMENVVNNEIVEGLIQTLDSCNPLVQSFRMARDRFRDVILQEVSIRLITTRNTSSNMYSEPTRLEIAAVIVGELGNEDKGRDIIVDCKGSGVRRIFENHPSFMALQYPLLFPFGEDGFHDCIPYQPTGGRKEIKRQFVTMREFYAFRLQRRPMEGKTLIFSGRLFQQYIVDAYTCVEDIRLRWIRNNQANLRVELYSGLRDAVFNGDNDPSKVGKKIILPSSFTGGKRYMVQNYQDAMAICRWAGYPDLFITFTCNPKWSEIEQGLLLTTGQRGQEGADLIVRVFKMKLTALMRDLVQSEHFGRVIAAMYTIEFQKRGLPHAHVLLFLHPDNKVPSVDHIDHFISAEVPDPAVDPLAFKIVGDCMVHGPCGPGITVSKCYHKGKCTKNFPKEFRATTTITKDGFPLYRRRSNGFTISKGRSIIDSRFVVPYNRDLLVKYNAHINVEWCNRSLSIKYLFKYVNKGSDRATVQLKNQVATHGSRETSFDLDETRSYLDCRYVSAAESCWRLFEFDIHFRKPSVERLSFHLEDDHTVTFSQNNSLGDVLNRPRVKDTMFTEWMSTNATHPEARQLTYNDFPTKWVWHSAAKTWTKRKQGFSVGRIYYVHPSSGERFYLRMLLNIVRGPTSFEELKTVNGNVYSTYKEACNALGLPENDQEWFECLLEASNWADSGQLRHLFVTILVHCQPAAPQIIWDQHWKLFCDDISYQQRNIFKDPSLELTEAQLKGYILNEIEQLLQQNGKSLSDFPEMPQLDINIVHQIGNRLLREELAYNIEEQQVHHSDLHRGLNQYQLDAYEAVINALQYNSGGFFFIYGHGGTGKSYLYRTILSYVRSQGKIALAVASSGIASLLLPGGRTAHSRFHIPLDIHETSICDVKQGSHVAQLLSEASIILWDEAPMAHKYCFESLDRSLRDLLHVDGPNKSDIPFGGKIVVLGGDFRQILPVVKKGNRSDIVNASINKSYLWKYCKVFQLHQNMRLSKTGLTSGQYEEIDRFANWILAVGDGDINSIEEDSTTISIPADLLIQSETDPLQAIVDSTYPHLLERTKNPTYLSSRAILAPTNEIVHAVNEHISNMMETEERIFRSVDSICNTSSRSFDSSPDLIPTEYLNSLKFPGLPNHILKLKIGLPIMLLRNLNQQIGLCNGTRLIVTNLSSKVIEAEIITGSGKGDRVSIPRITLSPSDATLPFVMKRLQFPVSVCFAMTINKSQGQSLTNVGIYLPAPVFTHGQLYVAISRVTSRKGLKFLIIDKDGKTSNRTANIVFKEAFSGL